MFEDDEEEKTLTLDEALQIAANAIRWLYFDYMLTIVPKPTFKSFKELYLSQVIPTWMDLIHDKYADHVEGTRKELDKIRKDQ